MLLRTSKCKYTILPCRLLSLRFLDLFQDSRCLGKDALKFAKSFQIAVGHQDNTTVDTKEDWFPMGDILKLFGSNANDYKDVGEALSATRHLCALNRAEH